MYVDFQPLPATGIDACEGEDEGEGWEEAEEEVLDDDPELTHEAGLAECVAHPQNPGPTLSLRHGAHRYQAKRNLLVKILQRRRRLPRSCHLDR